MAKKERNSGLGRGLDSLIPNIAEENEVEEGISLEDLMKDSETTSEDEEKIIEELKTEEEIIKEEKTEDETEEDIPEETSQEEDISESTDEDDIPKESSEVKKDSETFTNVLGNDDEIAEKSETAKVDYKEELSTKTVDRLSEKASEIQNEEPVKDMVDDESIPNIEDDLNINEDESFISKEDEKNISEIIETVEKNPRVTLWSARSAAVLRYLRKTQPEFSISKEASKLIDEAIAEEYPEIWTLFNHL